MLNALRSKWAMATGGALLLGSAMIADGVVITRPDEVKMILSGGDPSGFAPQGISLKVPLYQSVFPATTSLEEYQVPTSSVALQNGTVTAQDIQSSVFIQFNGTREERQETLSMIRERMPDYEARIQSLAEGALRDTVRLTYIASADADEEDTATKRPGAAIDFLDSEAVGEKVKDKLQAAISAVVPGTVMVGDEEVPRLEVAEYRIGNFEFDADYISRRQQIADARAASEAARFREAEAIRDANAIASKADGARRAEIARAQGEAEGIKLVQEAQAEGLRQRVDAAGGAEALRQQTLAERWNGQSPNVVGGDNVIVDGRFAPGVDVTAPVSATQKPAGIAP